MFDVDAGYGDALVARLNRFKIRVKADVERAAMAGPVRVSAVTTSSAPTAPPPDGVAKARPSELEAVRVADGWPAMGAEIEPGETIPAETGVVAVAVDFRKGCYPGQELVERMDSRGAAAPRGCACSTSSRAPRRRPDPARRRRRRRAHDRRRRLGLGYVKRGIDLGRLPTH